MQFSSGAHVTDNFSIVITVRRKIDYAIHSPAITSLQRFAMLFMIKTIAVLTLQTYKLEQHWISIELEFRENAICETDQYYIQ